MSSSRRLLALTFVFLSTLLTLPAQTPPIRIMPLGDSITDGSSQDTDGYGGYRRPLYYSLTGLGYNVDYIGSLTNNSSQIPDPNHEGHSGWRIDQLDTNIAGWFATMADPDVVLMHIGTNDFGQNFQITTAIDRLDALILKIATLRPYCHIIVTNLMERAGTANTNIVNLFNPQVQARVNAHAAAGRRVTFLDMRSAVPLSDMPDNLHPNQNGYNKMAAAWLPAVQAVIGPNGDGFAPEIYRVRGTDQTHTAITFSKPVADASAVAGNFAISGGITITGAALDASKRIVTLTTNPQAPGAAYTVTVNNVEDRITPVPNIIAPGSTANFLGAIPRGYVNNVPESSGYTLAYSLDVPSVANYATAAPAYSVDNRNGIGPFDRVAYYVELQTDTGALQYLWASMGAFTADVNRIAVPTASSGAIFQQSVANLNVVSNVAGVATGTGMTGNLEFWPTSYTQANAAAVPGASGSTYDFGDTRSGTGTYGSMQVHNTGAAQTAFAFNNWGGTTTTTGADLGIGNQPANSPDWTTANNAAGYTVKTIQVLVRTSGDVTSPAMVSAIAKFGPTRITVTFSEPIALSSVQTGNFSLNGGVAVLGATLSANQREVLLITTTQPPGTPLTLSVTGVRDTSPNANLIAPGAGSPVTVAALPAEIVANVGAAADGYYLLYSLNVPATGNLVSGTGFTAYGVNNSADAGTFSRVAYYLELQKTGDATSSYVWTSMNAFTTNAAQVGVPTPASAAVFQQVVSNLTVVSNVAGVVNGTGIATGNIEFWPSDSTAPNGAGIPGASATALDFGDTRSGTGTQGSMQVHNHGAGQTLFAINNWGTANNSANVLSMGIGNNPNGAQAPDYLSAANGSTYDIKRVLHVLALPGNTDVTGPAFVSAKGSATLDRLVVEFNEPVADTVVAANFSINGGVTVTGATLLPGNREIILTTSAQTPGTLYTVTATGIRDRSAAGNFNAPGASVAFTAFSPPAVLANVPETAGYKLIYQLAIPSASPRWNVNPIPYSVDESKYGEQGFDRVAYLMELNGNWACASFDRHTTAIGKIGIPTLGITATAFQQNVAHLNVASNVAGVVNGTDIATGNIEFWGGNYSVANALSVPGASATTFDFGDTMAAGTYGSMQIHNHGASQTILAYNNWGTNAGQTSETGIGNNPSATGTGSGQQADWTFTSNASAFTTRNLYVLIRPAPLVPVGAAPVLLSHPVSRTVPTGGNATFAVTASGTAPLTYQWRLNGVPIAGATNSFLALTGITAGQFGSYDVIVTAANGVPATSTVATLALSNTPPTFTGYAFTMQKDAIASVPFAGLIAKASDPDGQALTVIAVSPASAQGGVVALGASAVTYTPATGFLGADSFTVTISDGAGGTVVGNVSATISPLAPPASGATVIAFRADGKMDVIFKATPGQAYEVQRSTDLANPLAWTTVATIAAGDDALIPFTDPAPPVPHAFYRAISVTP